MSDNVAAIWLPFGCKTVRDGARRCSELEYKLSDSNGRNRAVSKVYETAALPLSYVGVCWFYV